MRFKMLKPMHGWRHFAGEVGIIVIGVLLALGAQQLAEAIHWRGEASVSMDSIEHQLAQNAGVFDERVLVQPCLDRRLKEVDTLLRAARVSGLLPHIGEIGRPPTRPILTSGWATAVNSGMTAHFDAGRRKELARDHSQILAYEHDVSEEQRLWATLRVLENAPGALSDGLLSQASATIAQLQFLTWLNGIVASQLMGEARKTGIMPDYYIVLDTSGSRRAVAESTLQRAVCKPLEVDGKPFSLEA